MVALVVDPQSVVVQGCRMDGSKYHRNQAVRIAALGTPQRYAPLSTEPALMANTCNPWEAIRFSGVTCSKDLHLPRKIPHE